MTAKKININLEDSSVKNYINISIKRAPKDYCNNMLIENNVEKTKV